MLNAAKDTSLVVTGSTNGNNSIGVTIGEQGGNVQVEILGSGPVTVNNPNSVATGNLTNVSSNHSQNANERNKNTAPKVVDTNDPARNNNGTSTATVVNGNNTQNGNGIDTNNNGSSNGITKPLSNSDNQKKFSHENKNPWSLGTALENGWDRLWSDLIGTPNDTDDVSSGNLGNSNGDLGGNGWNDGGSGSTSNVNPNEISNGNNNYQDSWW